MRRWNRQVIAAIVAVLVMPGFASAQWQQSSSYGMNESQIGGNGLFNSVSGHYSINPVTDDGGASLGAAAVGSGISNSYSTSAGFDTTAQPGLTFTVNGGSISLGTLLTSAAATATATFSVKDYTSSGYFVTLAGTAPANGAHALAAMGTQLSNSSSCSPSCTSTTGTEQFGINMRANTSPATFGADPVPIPSAAYSLYLPSTVLPLPYRTVNSYRFFSGDEVASAPSSSGETDYTMSFLANISATTPGGQYQGNLTLIATGSY